MNTHFLKSVLYSGIIAAVVFIILELILNPLILGTPAFGPPRMMAAIVMGKGVLPPPATFDLGIMMAGMLLHIVLSIIFALILSLIIRNLSMEMALLVGAIFGLALYLVNFYGFTEVFPWFAKARNWVQIVIHILFGLIAAWSFKGFQAREPTEVSHE